MALHTQISTTNTELYFTQIYDLCVLYAWETMA